MKTTQSKNEYEIWTDTSPKKAERWPLSLWKMVHIMSWGRCGWKQWDTTMHLQERKHWHHPSLDKRQKERTFHSLLENKNGVAASENSWAISYKTKHTLSTWFSNSTTCYLSKWTENLSSQQNMHMDVYNSFIYNCQDLDSTKISFSGRLEEHTVIQPDNKMLFINKRKWAIKS